MGAGNDRADCVWLARRDLFPARLGGGLRRLLESRQISVGAAPAPICLCRRVIAAYCCFVVLRGVVTGELGGLGRGRFSARKARREPQDRFSLGLGVLTAKYLPFSKHCCTQLARIGNAAHKGTFRGIFLSGAITANTGYHYSIGPAFRGFSLPRRLTGDDEG